RRFGLQSLSAVMQAEQQTVLVVNRGCTGGIFLGGDTVGCSGFFFSRSIGPPTVLLPGASKYQRLVLLDVHSVTRLNLAAAGHAPPARWLSFHATAALAPAKGLRIISSNRAT